jgi:hypothetical protein
MRSVEEIIHELRARLASCSSREPDGWPMTVEKADLRALLDHIDHRHDEEHHHLSKMTALLG